MTCASSRPERSPGAWISGGARPSLEARVLLPGAISLLLLRTERLPLPGAWLRTARPSQLPRSWCGRNRFWVLMQRNSLHRDGPGLAPRDLRGHGKPRLRPRSASPRFLVSKVRLTEFLRGQCDEHELEDFGSEITKYVEHLVFVGYLTRATHFIVRVALGQLPD